MNVHQENVEYIMGDMRHWIGYAEHDTQLCISVTPFKLNAREFLWVKLIIWLDEKGGVELLQYSHKEWGW